MIIAEFVAVGAVVVVVAGEECLRGLAAGVTVEAAGRGGARRGGPSLCKDGVEGLESGIQARRGARSGAIVGHRGKPAIEGLVGFVRRRYYRELLRLALLHDDHRNLRVQSNTRATVVVGEGDFQSLRLDGSERSHRGCHGITVVSFAVT